MTNTPIKDVKYRSIIYPPDLALVRGAFPDHVSNTKFGHNDSVGTSYVPLVSGGAWQTPMVGSEQFLRIKAGDANDTILGTGARVIAINGLDVTGAEITEYVDTAGATASAYTTTKFLRVNRAWVHHSGTYATTSIGSHTAKIVVEDAGANVWAEIVANGHSEAQSQIGCYAVPLGVQAYVDDWVLKSEASKSASIRIYLRQKILQTAAPFEARRLLVSYDGLEGIVPVRRQRPHVIPSLSDIIVMGKLSASTGLVGIDFSFEQIPV